MGGDNPIAYKRIPTSLNASSELSSPAVSFVSFATDRFRFWLFVSDRRCRSHISRYLYVPSEAGRPHDRGDCDPDRRDSDPLQPPVARLALRDPTPSRRGHAHGSLYVARDVDGLSRRRRRVDPAGGCRRAARRNSRDRSPCSFSGRQRIVTRAGYSCFSFARHVVEYMSGW